MQMKKYEYHIELLQPKLKLFSNWQEDRIAVIKASIDPFAAKGWRVVSLEVLPQLAYNEGSIGILFEREIAQ
jgi:hypothetical protein